MNIIRLNIIDQSGTVSFVAPCHMMKVVTAACSRNPENLSELLDYTQDYDPTLKRNVLNGLAIFDEHNTQENISAIQAELGRAKPEHSPVFRIVDKSTRDASLTPVKAGLIIFNLLARRIIQVQNSYANLERQDRGRVRYDGKPTRLLYRYELPDEWQLVP